MKRNLFLLCFLSLVSLSFAQVNRVSDGFEATVKGVDIKVQFYSPDIVRVLHGCGKAAYFSHHFLWDIGHYFQSKMMMMGRYVELFMDYAAQLECARSLTENDFAIICSVGGSYLTRYPDICNAIISSGCKVLVITQNLASPYLNTADFILQCGTTNRNDVGKYAALMANDLIVMGYMRAYDKAFQ